MHVYISQNVCLHFTKCLFSPTDIHVLLQQRTCSMLQTNIHLLRKLLQKLILPAMETQVTPTECMEGVEKWWLEEIKLLSEMTMDSLYLLMSNYIEYDTRWNELFARRELPDHLIEIQVNLFVYVYLLKFYFHPLLIY